MSQKRVKTLGSYYINDGSQATFKFQNAKHTKFKDLITLGKEYDSWNFKKSKAEILIPSLPLG